MIDSSRTVCGATTKAGGICQSFAVTSEGKCFMHSPTTTPEMKSAAGRAGAATVNLAAARRKNSRELEKAQAAQAEATSDIGEKTAALVNIDPALAPLNVSTPAAVESVIVKAIQATWEGSLPPARARAVNELLNTRIKLADLEMTKLVLDLKEKLDARDGGGARRPGRRNVPTKRFSR
jgi:hypothetical protein